MRAVVTTGAGPDDVRVEEVDEPVLGDDSLLVRVAAASWNVVDLAALGGVGRVGRFLRRSRKSRFEVLGHDFAGTVESIGRGVSQFKPGDQVFGARVGAFAEYVCMAAARSVVSKPANVTFEQAAAVPVAGVTALQALRDHGHVQAGQRVLVNGASGAVGTFAVQLAKAFGAQVTGVCSTGNVELVRSLGADQVIDYSREDFTRSGERYELMIDIAGSHPWSECVRVLDEAGTIVVVGASALMHGPGGGAGRVLGHLLAMRLASVIGRRRSVVFLARVTTEALIALRDLMAAGKLGSAIDRRYTMEQAVEAARYLREGHARAKLVMTVADH